ncbi:MAG TPA: RpoL/Rpb11 RNA polymerase subunit family protein [Nitrososphaeraceae archaeon]|jgi:DNA-directed RNA polymerase subunit L
MLAEIIQLRENELELKIEEEDISVMYIIQHELLKQTAVEFAGVMLKHPLIKDYMMRLLTNKKDPVEALSEATTIASEYVRKLAKTFSDVMNSQ